MGDSEGDVDRHDEEKNEGIEDSQIGVEKKDLNKDFICDNNDCVITNTKSETEFDKDLRGSHDFKEGDMNRIILTDDLITNKKYAYKNKKFNLNYEQDESFDEDETVCSMKESNTDYAVDKDDVENFDDKVNEEKNDCNIKDIEDIKNKCKNKKFNLIHQQKVSFVEEDTDCNMKESNAD